MLGEFDVYVIVDYPDNMTAAGLLSLLSTNGTAKVRTVVLVTATEIDDAARPRRVPPAWRHGTVGRAAGGAGVRVGRSPVYLFLRPRPSPWWSSSLWW